MAIKLSLVRNLYLRARENTKGEIDHLKILRTGDRRERVGLRADVEDVRLLQNRDQEMSPFADGLVHHSSESIEDHSSLSAVNGV